ncbi:MAG: alpha/beta hydrolase, partial [Clostridia bacterium]
MNYFRTHKKSLIFLAIALGIILLSSFAASLVQSSGYQVTVTDLRNESNTGTKVVAVEDGKDISVAVAGEVKSGILFVPKSASATNKLPAVVLTHGYLNNRELQLQNAIELSRRGFIVLTIDRGGHGNNESTGDISAMMDDSGLYEACKYVYNMDCVDQSKIGVSGHSMGGYSTAMVLYKDMFIPGKAYTKTGTTVKATGTNLGIVSAGLMQGWSQFIAAGANVAVGNLKAKDDEFFYQSTDAQGEATISRQYLQSKACYQFLTGKPHTAGDIDFKTGEVYLNGAQVKTLDKADGVAVAGAIRVVYEADEIHPLNHFSTESASYVTNFFYTSLGTPKGFEYIAEGNETWWIKEAFSTIGLVGFFMLVLPVADLLLTIPVFAGLRKKKLAEGEIEVSTLPVLAGVRKHVSYWAAAVATTLFSGFMIEPIFNDDNLVSMFFTQTNLFPQDTTAQVATWAIICGLFALLCVGLVWGINHIINRVKYKEGYAIHDEHPLAAARIEGGVPAFLKTIVLALLTVTVMYVITFINWGIWTVDFRFWSFDVKVFDVATMLPTMLRYMVPFAIFYCINSIFNQGYKVKNLPEWATIAINAVFNVLGIVIVIAIQYITFRSTGILWQDSMALGYIVLFPIIPVLIIATVLSRRLY